MQRKRREGGRKTENSDRGVCVPAPVSVCVHTFSSPGCRGFLEAFPWHPVLVSKFSSLTEETRFQGGGGCGTGGPEHLVGPESKDVVRKGEGLKGQKNQMEGAPKAKAGQFGQGNTEVTVLKGIEYSKYL